MSQFCCTVFCVTIFYFLISRYSLSTQTFQYPCSFTPPLAHLNFVFRYLKYFTFTLSWLCSSGVLHLLTLHSSIFIFNFRLSEVSSLTCGVFLLSYQSIFIRKQELVLSPRTLHSVSPESKASTHNSPIQPFLNSIHVNVKQLWWRFSHLSQTLLYTEQLSLSLLFCFTHFFLFSQLLTVSIFHPCFNTAVVHSIPSFGPPYHEPSSLPKSSILPQ